MTGSKGAIRSAHDFNEAFLQGYHVEVWDGDAIEDYGGPIEKHIKDAVKINGTYYMKWRYEFKVQ